MKTLYVMQKILLFTSMATLLTMPSNAIAEEQSSASSKGMTQEKTRVMPERSKYYCALYETRRHSWEKEYKRESLSATRMLEAAKALGIMDGTHPTLYPLVKIRLDNEKRSEIALSRLFDSTIPILILLGNSEDYVLRVRSQITGGEEWTKKREIGITIHSHEYFDNWGKGIGLFTEEWNQEIRTFCSQYTAK